MTELQIVLVWVLAITTILLMLWRPRGIVEAWWICGGALALVGARLISVRAATQAVSKGVDVYLFLAGMMLLSELARQEGVFDWLASHAVRASDRSPLRLFALVYAVGVVVTTFLSNDATAVVLTPAVFAAVTRAKARPLPYLYACAFVANAASFVLPISNPANLVIYGQKLPHLAEWLRTFAFASAASIVLTFVALWWTSRSSLREQLQQDAVETKLSRAGLIAAAGLAFATTVLVTASALGIALGWPTLGAALFAWALVALRDRAALTQVPRHVAWSILPLVAGLFVIVEALSAAGLLNIAERALDILSRLTPATARIAAAFAAGLLSNVMNNLPVGLASGAALQHSTYAAGVQSAVLVGVDLGPNLSVTGSLATILWLIALRREGLDVTAWQFLKFGAFVMTPALLISALVLVQY
ncbi:MAG: arsenic transporter [Acidobacteriaceae bacterium]